MTLHAVLAKPAGNLVSKLADSRSNLVPALEILWEGVTVAHRLGGRVLTCGGHRGAILAAGEIVELDTVFPQQGEQLLTVKCS